MSIRTMNSSDTEAVIMPLGQALKEARLQSGLSIEQAAAKLNLGPCMLAGLEDELDNIITTKKYPTIYLRGYLGNYAKLVGLTQLNSFSEYQQLSLPVKAERELRAPKLIPPPAKKRPKLLLLFILSLITLIAVFIYQERVLFEKIFNEGLGQFGHVEMSTSQEITLPLVAGAQSVDENRLIEESNVDAQLTLSEQEATPLTAIESDLTQQADRPETASYETSQVEKDDINGSNEKFTGNVITADNSAAVFVEPVSGSGAAVSDSETAVSDSEATPASRVETLSLAFTADCWTEVFDATGERIAFGLYKNGRVLMLNGIAPFQLKLGDPSVVEIQYKDQIIDGEFTPGRSAQFSVPLS